MPGYKKAYYVPKKTPSFGQPYKNKEGKLVSQTKSSIVAKIKMMPKKVTKSQLASAILKMKMKKLPLDVVKLVGSYL